MKKRQQHKPTPPSGFYAIQPISSVPGHIKLGYSTNFASRLKAYYTLCPDARIVRVWYCWNQETEHAAMAHAEQQGFKRIGTEVFQVDNLPAFFSCLDQFFLAIKVSELRKMGQRRHTSDEEMEADARQILEELNKAVLALNKPLALATISLHTSDLGALPTPERERKWNVLADGPLLTMEDFAEKTGLSYQQVTNLVQTNKVRYVQIARTIRILPFEVERFIKTG